MTQEDVSMVRASIKKKMKRTAVFWFAHRQAEPGRRSCIPGSAPLANGLSVGHRPARNGSAFTSIQRPPPILKLRTCAGRRGADGDCHAIKALLFSAKYVVPDTSEKGPYIDFGQVFEGISKVKLRGGVVGRVCWVLIFSVVAIALIIGAAVAFPSSSVVAIIGIVAIILVVCPFLNRIITFADKNPQAALLEGAEFIKYEQIRAGMKSSPMLPPSATEDPKAIKEVAIDPNEAVLPDATVTNSKRIQNG